MRVLVAADPGVDPHRLVTLCCRRPDSELLSVSLLVPLAAGPEARSHGGVARAGRLRKASALLDEKGKLAYVTGSTASADFPTTGQADDTSYNGAGDAFLTSLKLSNEQLVLSTFLGGTENDAGIAVAVGADRKRAYVTGSSSSADVFIASHATHQHDDG